MSFTDEDLKFLKEQTDQAVDHKWNYPHWSKIQAVLARLEAAEALEQYWKYYEPTSADDEKEYNSMVEAWRKAAGK